MRAQFAGIALFFLILSDLPIFAGDVSAKPPDAKFFWEMGQAALRSRLYNKAVELYSKSLELDGQFHRSYLGLAAAFMELNQRDKALPCLAKYVGHYPEDLSIRPHYAELLMETGKPAEAIAELEKCIALAHELGETSVSHLINFHSRIMKIAEAQEDVHAEHLHRGIGLYWLARDIDAMPNGNEVLPSESLLCKAAAELTLALEACPDEARASWYLYTVWSRLAQRQPARRCLGEANAVANFSYLTPFERRNLYLAVQGQVGQSPK